MQVKLNAQIIQHATPNIIQIINIYNACISTGYFQKAFNGANYKKRRGTTNPSNELLIKREIWIKEKKRLLGSHSSSI